MIPSFLFKPLNLNVDRVSKLVQSCLEENDWNDCFIVECLISPARKIEVYLDSDSGISFTICRKVSRYIEEVIDETKEFGESYTLEVSSSGVGRPLKIMRQYHNNIGRKVVVKTNEGLIKGKLLKVSESEIIVNQEKSKKNSKKKILIENCIDMNDILETKVVAAFK